MTEPEGDEERGYVRNMETKRSKERIRGRVRN